MQSLKEFFFYETKYLRKGAIIYRAEDLITNIYYLVSGNVRQYIISSDGNEYTIHIYKPGSYFPITIVLAGIENRFYFEALNNVKVKVVSTNKVIAFLERNPKELMHLTKRLSKGLFGVVNRLEELGSHNVEDRLYSLLSYFSRSFPNNPTPTHQNLSSWLGVSRETVTRNIKKLKIRNRIQKESRRIVVL